MHPVVREISCWDSPESLACRLQREPGLVFLRSSLFGSPQARYSFLAVRPFLRFRSYGSRCELSSASKTHIQFGNPWRILSDLISRYELLDEVDLPFPLGGCFGYWGYDLKHFVEPKLGRHAVNDLDLPDCQVGFYDSLLVYDHRLAKTWIVSVGLTKDGSQSEVHAHRQADWWQQQLSSGCPEPQPESESCDHPRLARPSTGSLSFAEPGALVPRPLISSTLTRIEFIRRVERAREYIKAGDIYQVNLSHRLSAAQKCSSWEFFQRLTAVSPAPFSAFLDCGTFQIASSSPELFLRLSGAQVQTRPIKGTRPRSPDPNRDAQLAYELQTSAKETAELVMITDLLRNDLGRCCEFGSVHTPDLLRLERFPQVQHLVSTVEGRLRTRNTHLEALAACFPGGSVTGAPKFRAMEIIEELEPTARGPYTGALGYLGFNRESQLSIVIRAAICKDGLVHFPVGAGIVAESSAPEEYEETLAKARGFLEVLQISSTGGHPRPDKASSAERSG